MKLSELVHYRNQLNTIDIAGIKTSAEQELAKVLYLINLQESFATNVEPDLATAQQSIGGSFNNFEFIIDNLKAVVNQQITEKEKLWFQESYRLYEEEMCYDTAEYILDRRPNITEQTEDFYRQRIIKYSDWRYPAMLLRPGKETFVNNMVACDPLYLVDESYDLLKPALGSFNKEYQRRLRPYAVIERQDGEILADLPDNQFGFIFAYNFFNFKPFEVIRKYLKEMHTKLRPGGVLAMSFNDCDSSKGVDLVERNFCCYTPGYLIVELASSIGYQPIFIQSDGGPSTWVEFQKPGTIISLRAGQALARILPKPVAKSK
jgi:SAM-dependent methyltransferase